MRICDTSMGRGCVIRLLFSDVYRYKSVRNGSWREGAGSSPLLPGNEVNKAKL